MQKKTRYVDKSLPMEKRNPYVNSCEKLFINIKWEILSCSFQFLFIYMFQGFFLFYRLLVYAVFLFLSLSCIAIFFQSNSNGTQKCFDFIVRTIVILVVKFS